jgi:iron(III) transport system substrate-binding protein
MKSPLRVSLAGAVLLLLPLIAQAQQQVVVYCSILEEQCREGAAIFERSTGIKVAMVRKSTGEVYAQLKAEASNPRADIWWGGPAEPHLQAGAEGLLTGYQSPALAGLHGWAVKLAEASGHRTAGTYLGALGVGYNTEVLKKKKIPEPSCWSDLLKSAYRDEVQMADPNSSGTAYVMLATMVQLFGEAKGFDYLKGLHRNINQYTKSGAAPTKALALGETGISIGFIHDMITQALAGAPIKTLVPCEGTGYETGAVSLVKGGKNPEAARKFFDWTLSKEAQDINFRLKIFSIPSNKNAQVSPLAPDLTKIKLIDYDAAKFGASAMRNGLLKRWTTEVKAAAK